MLAHRTMEICFDLKSIFYLILRQLSQRFFGFFQISSGVSQVEIDSIFIAENVVRDFLGISNFLLPNWVFFGMAFRNVCAVFCDLVESN